MSNGEVFKRTVPALAVLVVVAAVVLIVLSNASDSVEETAQQIDENGERSTDAEETADKVDERQQVIIDRLSRVVDFLQGKADLPNAPGEIGQPGARGLPGIGVRGSPGQDGTDGESIVGRQGEPGESITGPQGEQGEPGRPPTSQEIADAVAAYLSGKQFTCTEDPPASGTFVCTFP